VTLTCPQGHRSETADYCDVCGRPIGAPAASEAAAPSAGTPPDLDDADTSTTTPPEPCPVCQTPRDGNDRFCELCGHDFQAPATPASAWEAVVRADRGQFERTGRDELRFPSGAPERRFALAGDRLRIGRLPVRAGDSVPEIGVADPCVSRLHAELERRDDGSYAVRDLDSSNGTTVGDGPAPLEKNTVVELADGDVIRIGAWTTITVLSR
jgi:hypothetical protein